MNTVNAAHALPEALSCNHVHQEYRSLLITDLVSNITGSRRPAEAVRSDMESAWLETRIEEAQKKAAAHIYRMAQPCELYVRIFQRILLLRLIAERIGRLVLSHSIQIVLNTKESIPVL